MTFDVFLFSFRNMWKKTSTVDCITVQLSGAKPLDIEDNESEFNTLS